LSEDQAKCSDQRVLAWIEERGRCAGIGIDRVGAIASTLVAVPARQREVVRRVGSAGRAWVDVVDCESHELPALVGVAVFAESESPLANELPRCK